MAVLELRALLSGLIVAMHGPYCRGFGRISASSPTQEHPLKVDIQDAMHLSRYFPLILRKTSMEAEIVCLMSAEAPR
jgi:hypothetical protein